MGISRKIQELQKEYLEYATGLGCSNTIQIKKACDLRRKIKTEKAKLKIC